MAVYEQIMIVKPEADQTQIHELLDRLAKLIAASGGKMKGTENLGLRDLAYPVAKYNKGRFYLLKFSAPGSLITELSEITRYNNNVLRFLVMGEAKASNLTGNTKVYEAQVKPKDEEAQVEPKDEVVTEEKSKPSVESAPQSVESETESN